MSSSTHLNAYTGRHGRKCIHDRCQNKKETYHCPADQKLTFIQHSKLIARNCLLYSSRIEPFLTTYWTSHRMGFQEKTRSHELTVVVRWREGE